MTRFAPILASSLSESAMQALEGRTLEATDDLGDDVVWLRLTTEALERFGARLDAGGASPAELGRLARLCERLLRRELRQRLAWDRAAATKAVRPDPAATRRESLTDLALKDIDEDEPCLAVARGRVAIPAPSPTPADAGLVRVAAGVWVRPRPRPR